jgi:hypothetical protein
MPLVLVVGGTGFLGQRTVAALQKVHGFEVRALSRRGTAPFDATRPATWQGLTGADLVVDLSDTLTVKPDEWVAWCLERQIPVLEATADMACVERLHQRFSRTPGTLILGGGIFTGMSNLLGRAAADAVESPKSVFLGISSSPFSGAGSGTIELMLASLRISVVRYRANARVEQSGMSPGPDFIFGNSRRATLLAPFAEAFMLHTSAGAQDVEVGFSPRPAFLVPSFRLLPPAFTHSRLGQALLRMYFTVLRRWLLGSVASPVELYARATSGDHEVERRLFAPDGMQAAAWALAAMCEAFLAHPTGAGVRFIDDVCGLAAIAARANALAGEAVMTLDGA